ncbi:MAG: methionine synthase [Candidatus Marsarchaeota archaeon]|nr:methionine synthase [Candidatus Marsarchaeota archaeon]
MELLPTTVIGSYPRPNWLKHALSLYRRGKIGESELESAMDDACKLVLKEHELAGVDIVTDGEMRRDEMVEFFAERLEGYRFYGDVRVWGTAHYNKPAAIAPIRYKAPMLVSEFSFARSCTSKRVKATITGPYTLADWSYNEYYGSKREFVMELAHVVRQELRNLVSAGADFVQVDEPALPTHVNEIELAKDGFNEAVRGVDAKTAVHVCYGDYSVMLPYLNEFNTSQFALEFANRRFSDLELFKQSDFKKELGFGVIDVHNRRVETQEEVEHGIKLCLNYLEPDKVYVNPDCGLKLLPKEIAFQKLVAMVNGTQKVRSQLTRR